MNLSILPINPNISQQENLNILNACNCCEKHKILKPKIFSKWYETTPNKGKNAYTSNTNPINNEPYCKCKCRHIARFICRNAK